MTRTCWMTALMLIVSCGPNEAGADLAPTEEELAVGEDALVDSAAAIGVAEHSPEAIGILRVVNGDLGTLSSTLRAGAHLAASAAASIVKFRGGQTFGTLKELDARPWVGVAQFTQLLTYARDNGLVPQPGKLIDWCGDGLDQDGDGKDRLCDVAAVKQVVRTIEVQYDSGGITVRGEGCTNTTKPNFVEPEFTVTYPRGFATKLRIINKTPWSVAFTGPSFGSIAAPNGTQFDEITLDAGPLTRWRLDVPNNAHPLSRLDVRLAYEGGDVVSTPEQRAYLKGTMTAGAVTWDATMTVTPEVGPDCGPSQQNVVTSVDACAGLSYCFLRARVDLVVVDRSTHAQTQLSLAPTQCNSYGTSSSSRLIWENHTLSITGYELLQPGLAHALSLSPNHPNVDGSLAGTTSQLSPALPYKTTLQMRFVAAL